MVSRNKGLLKQNVTKACVSRLKKDLRCLTECINCTLNKEYLSEFYCNSGFDCSGCIEGVQYSVKKQQRIDKKSRVLLEQQRMMELIGLEENE